MVSVPSSPQVITAFVEWTRTLKTSKKKRRTYPVTVYNLPSFRVEYLWPFQVKFCLRLKKTGKKNTNHFHSGNSSQHGSCPFQTQPYHSSWREHICEEFRHLISSWESMKSTKKNSIYRFHIKIIQIHNLSIGGTSDSQEVSRDWKRVLMDYTDWHR